MSAHAIRREPIAAHAEPSVREIDAFARGSGARLRAPRYSARDVASAEIATVGALMSFVDRTLAAREPDPDARKMARCLRVGDYDGALFVASVLAYRDPTDWCARRVKAWCAGLSNAARSGTRSMARAVPTMTFEWDVLAEFPLTREQAYLLSLVDGISTVSEVLDASGFAPDVAASTLAELLAARLIVVRT
jgi:hypothetical protein